MPTRNFNTPILDADNKPMKYKDAEGEVTIKKAVTMALFMQSSDDRSTGEQKYKSGQLALRISNSEDDIDISSEEIIIIKNAVGKLHDPLTVVRVYDFLEKDKA